MTDALSNQSFDETFRGFYRVHRTAQGQWGAFLFYQDLRDAHLTTNVDHHHFYGLEERRFSDFFDEHALRTLTRRFGDAAVLGKVIMHMNALKDVARECGRGDGRVPRPN